jgi:hypothetical protein
MRPDIHLGTRPAAKSPQNQGRVRFEARGASGLASAVPSVRRRGHTLGMLPMPCILDISL